jgi:hypothetical protein
VAYLNQIDQSEVAGPPPFTTTQQAETAVLGGGVVVASNNAGYNGTGFADYPATTGSTVRVTWTVNAPTAGAHTVSFRYANGGGANRPLRIVVNGVNGALLNFAATASWTTWTAQTSSITLNAGNNTIALVAETAAGPNLDEVTVSKP